MHACKVLKLKDTWGPENIVRSAIFELGGRYLDAGRPPLRARVHERVQLPGNGGRSTAARKQRASYGNEGPRSFSMNMWWLRHVQMTLTITIQQHARRALWLGMRVYVPCLSFNESRGAAQGR